MRILFATAELAPFAQTGGLGDAVAGLASALRARGHELICALPAYRDLLAHPELPKLGPGERVVLDEPEGTLRGAWRTGRLPSGVELRLLDLPGLYDRPGLYADPTQEARRFTGLARAVADLATSLAPDVLVAHDWHTALAIGLLRTRGRGGPAAVQVVHNGSYTGRFAATEMARTGLPPALFSGEGVEFFGDLCLLKAGLAFADRIVAVSPRYAAELATPEFGGGLDGLYRARADRLVGIANGIDTVRFDPAHDPALGAPFSADRPEGRARCREALLDELRLTAPKPGRLLTAIGRLTVQKGWDVLAQSLSPLVASGASIALLGDGDAEIARALASAGERHPGRVRLLRGWNEPLARRLYAGSDAVLVPSRFEPCGLVQLLAQRYGSLPVAHRVGGLLDTIVDGETGILFAPLSAESLVAAAERAADLLSGASGSDVRARLLGLDVSWAEPARRWEVVLEEALRAALDRN